MSDIFEHTPTPSRFAKHCFTRLSNSSPRLRRSRRMRDSKPEPRERAYSAEPAQVLLRVEPRYLLSADISPFVNEFNFGQTYRAGSISVSTAWPLSWGRGLIS